MSWEVRLALLGDLVAALCPPRGIAMRSHGQLSRLVELRGRVLYSFPTLRSLVPHLPIPALLLTMALALLLPDRANSKQVPATDNFSALLRDGFSLHQRADYTDALPVLKRARTLRPHDYFVNLLLGIDLLRTGKSAESVRYLQEASRQQPTEDIPFGYLGEAQAQNGKYAEAAQAYAQAVQVAPQSAQATESAIGYALERFRTLSAELRSSSQGLAADHRLQAMIHAANDPMREQLLQEAPALDPEAPGLWGELAIASAIGDEEVHTKEYLARAAEQNPNDLRALEAHAILAARKNDWKTTSLELNAVASRSPGSLARSVQDWPRTLQPSSLSEVSGAAEDFLECVRIASATCDLGVAGGKFTVRASPSLLYREQRWEQLANLPPPARADAQAWFWRGAAFANLGLWRNAIPALERSLTDRHDGTYARFLLCWTYAQSSDDMQRMLQAQNGDPASMHVVKGDVLLRMQGSGKAAIKEYSAALQSRTDDPTLLERLAEAQFSDGQPEAAVQNAQAALRIDPLRFTAMQTLARVAMEQRNYKVALPYLLQLTAQNPNDAASQVELGTALAETGNQQGALDHLGPPLERGYPDERGNLHALLGTVLRKLGRKGESAQAFTTARSLSERYQTTVPRGAYEQN